METSGQRLRRVVACPECALQYEAGDRQAGSRFHCACGEVLTVREAPAHDAPVVRCSACGAPRESDAKACGFCSADFTLHEQDLHTMCPQCMTRISDRAGFCHSCGLAILPQGEPGALSGRHCPTCGDAHELRVRSVEENVVSVLECGRCAGLWVGHQIFEVLEKRANDSVAAWPELPKPEKPLPRRNLEQDGETFYRTCVQCGSLMHRTNYGRKSGVIIDVCRDHGIWFDRGELDEILAWVKTGGARRAEALAKEEARTRPRPGSLSPVPLKGTRGSRGIGDFVDFGSSLVEVLVDFLIDA